MPAAAGARIRSALLKQPLAVHLSPAGGVATHAIAALDISATLIRESLARGASPAICFPMRFSNIFRPTGLPWRLMRLDKMVTATVAALEDIKARDIVVLDVRRMTALLTN